MKSLSAILCVLLLMVSCARKQIREPLIGDHSAPVVFPDPKLNFAKYPGEGISYDGIAEGDLEELKRRYAADTFRFPMCKVDYAYGIQMHSYLDEDGLWHMPEIVDTDGRVDALAVIQPAYKLSEKQIADLLTLVNDVDSYYYGFSNHILNFDPQFGFTFFNSKGEMVGYLTYYGDHIKCVPWVARVPAQFFSEQGNNKMKALINELKGTTGNL